MSAAVLDGLGPLVVVVALAVAVERAARAGLVFFERREGGERPPDRKGSPARPTAVARSAWADVTLGAALGRLFVRHERPPRPRVPAREARRALAARD